MTIIELIGLLCKTSPSLNNKKVLVDVMINDDGDDSKSIYGCEVTHASFDQDNNIIFVCRGNK